MITKPDVDESTTAAIGRAWAPRWWLVLPIGLVLWIATVADTMYTSNLILLPTVVLLGSFLVPVTGVVWYLDHDGSPALSARRIVSAFILSGVLGALAASVLEYWLVYFLSVPSLVIEELVRAVLAPFGHGLWTAILGGVIFRGARNGRLRPTLAIVITYAGVSLLHAAFDSFGGIVGYVVISIIGIIPLVYLWLREDRGLPFVHRQPKAPVAERIQGA